MKDNAAEAPAPPGHEEMSSRIELATLEGMAGAVPVPPGMEQPAPAKKYQYSEEEAAAHAENIVVPLLLWSSRWQRVQPLSDKEAEKLAAALGRWVAWKFPGKDSEVHPTMAVLTAAGSIALPRVYELYLQAQAEAQAAEEELKKPTQGQPNATATH